MKTVDVMPGDTWTTSGGLMQYRNRERRIVWVDKLSQWEDANRGSVELDCTPAQAMNILAAYGYTINHAQPEAKPVRVTHGVMHKETGAIMATGASEEACRGYLRHFDLNIGVERYSVVPLTFGPEGA